MSRPSPEWGVVGSYRKRPVPQGEILDLLTAASNEAVSAEDAPILIYDMKTTATAAKGHGSSAFTLNNSSSCDSEGSNDKGHDRSNANVAPALRVPRYIATKISIPPPPTVGHPATSSSGAASADLPLKVISLAPPFSLRDVTDAEDVLNIDCAEAAPDLVRNPRRNQRVGSTLVLATQIPAPSQLSFILPFVLFLGDVAVLAASVTIHETRRGLIAACCVLVLVPDILTLVLVVKKGSICTSIALHLLLWTNVILLFLQPYTSPLFFTHFILLALMVLFVLRLRGSSRSTYCVLA